MKRQDTHQTLRLSADMKAQVNQLGQAKQMTAGEIIREALAIYLKSQSA
ncbi:ribbon-helix-helix protein, CopG family [Nostoc sp.]